MPNISVQLNICETTRVEAGSDIMPAIRWNASTNVCLQKLAKVVAKTAAFTGTCMHASLIVSTSAADSDSESDTLDLVPD
jgi:hypothetical protein